MMSSSQPLCTAFLSKSSGKYLQCHADDTQVLHVSGGDAVNPYTRFYIEPSTKHNGLVHIRCCYNNKYWVSQQHHNDDEWWIAGGANEPGEDLSMQSCTLFQLKTDGEDANTVRFIHCQQGKHCGIVADTNQANGALQACLHVNVEEQSQPEYFTLVDLLPWALPKHVCFKGDNGQYLTVETIGGMRRLIFSAKDMEDPDARYTTTLEDGRVIRLRTRSPGLGLFWRRASVPNDWVLPDFSGTSSDHGRSSIFQPIFFDDRQIIVLRNMANNRYCRRLTTGPTTEGFITNGLAAMESNIDEPEAKMWWEEPVVSREVSVLQFHLGIRTRIYDEKQLTLATASATNDTASPATVKLTFKFTLTEMRRWSSSMTLSSAVKTTISSKVPYRVSRRFGFSEKLIDFNSLYSWGAINQKTTRETALQFVLLPAKTRVTGTLTAETSSYDVPFSYRQADTLIGGEDTLELHDGLYSGQNIHNLEYKYETEQI